MDRPLLFEVRAAPPFMTNGFVLACQDTREGVIIDPGDCVDELLEIVRARQLEITYILLSHAHLDHVTGVGRAKAATGAPVVLHRADLLLYDTVVQQGMMFGLRVERQPPVDAFYDMTGPGERESRAAAGSDANAHAGASTSTSLFRFGRFQIGVYHTPGHCPGGVCLKVDPPAAHEPGGTLIVGDTLFAGSIGRTDLPGGDFPTLIRSIREVLFPFGDAAVVHPGHGDSTTIGDERRANPFLI